MEIREKCLFLVLICFRRDLIFYISKNYVQEQDGDGEFYLLPDDIEFLAKDKAARIAFLQTVGKQSAMIAGARKREEAFFELVETLDSGSGFHSKL